MNSSAFTILYEELYSRYLLYALYPAFYPNGVTCVNDCNDGDNEWPPRYSTLEECCAVHHSWAGPNGFEDCMGLTKSPSVGPTILPSRSPSKPPTSAVRNALCIWSHLSMSGVREIHRILLQ